MLIASLLPEPTENPERKPFWTEAKKNLLRASITITNSSGDSGSPCLRPRELLKKPVGEPFTNSECYCVENGAFVPLVVSMEENE
jgi:hypothetical protein